MVDELATIDPADHLAIKLIIGRWESVVLEKKGGEGFNMTIYN
jgi:hypothetical protein